MAPTDQHLEDISHFEHVPRRHLWRWFSAALIVAILVWIGIQFARGQIDWPVVADFLFAPTILEGVQITVIMTILAMTVGIVLGVVVAVMRLSKNPILVYSALGYVWLFRGLPSLLQLLLWFNLALVFPTVAIPGLFEARTVDVMTPFVAALLALGINQGAYTSEVVRAGLLSVDQGQYEAASAIGMRPLKALRRIVLPQAMRVIVPPIGNEVISMVKWTSLASVIQLTEVMHSAQNIYYVNSHVMELLIVAGIWYIFIVTILSEIQRHIERHYSKGISRPKAKS